jgi:hypothetical protein
MKFSLSSVQSIVIGCLIIIRDSIGFTKVWLSMLIMCSKNWDGVLMAVMDDRWEKCRNDDIIFNCSCKNRTQIIKIKIVRNLVMDGIFCSLWIFQKSSLLIPLTWT